MNYRFFFGLYLIVSAVTFWAMPGFLRLLPAYIVLPVLYVALMIPVLAGFARAKSMSSISSLEWMIVGLFIGCDLFSSYAFALSKGSDGNAGLAWLITGICVVVVILLFVRLAIIRKSPPNE